VTLEPAELAAGLPMAASFAMAGGIAALRDGRRRGSLNEAMHELRRPLQALALALSSDSASPEGAESSLRMAVSALERLDREINGREQVDELRRVPLRPFLEAAVARWQEPARRAGISLSLQSRVGEMELLGDPVELAQAVDNLISNALEHGGGKVTVGVRAGVGAIRITVLDSGRGGTARRSRGRAGFRDRLSGRSRHGHGLRIVRRVAVRHGGRFGLRRRSGGTEARLELPLAGSRW
jgi:signal transduction histidine kinase